MFVGGTLLATLPRLFAPGTRRLEAPPKVGSCALISGDRHSGGNTIGGGFGDGANVTRFSPPKTILTGNAEVVDGASEFEPPAESWTCLRPVEAQMLPPPAWQPKGAPLLKALSSACPMTMSPTDSSSGARASTSPSELSLVSVNTPSEPPSIVQVPGASGGIRLEPSTPTFGLFG